MAFDPDRFYDRRRLKLSVAFWRTLAVFAIVLLAVVAVARFGFDGVRGERIVRLWLNDVIVDDPDREAALIDLAEDARTRAVIVRIDTARAAPRPAARHSISRFGASRRTSPWSR
jgi:hypothetical protein